MNDILSNAKAISGQIVEDRRFFHKNPEIASDLRITSEYIFSRLRSLGYSPKIIAKCGIVADIGNPENGKCILLRSDMDALPIEEKTELEYKSKNGFMHACGHDTHMAMLLGAAMLLKQHEDRLCGMVRLMFQPDEENIKGAVAMIDEGVLENPAIDCAMAIHALIPYKAGKIGSAPGPFCSSDTSFRITVNGIGGHGSSPHLTIDPINTAVQIYNQLTSIITREISAFEFTVLTIGKFCAGDVSNIIPGNAVLEGTLRTFSEDVRSFAVNRIQEIINLVAKANRASVDFEILKYGPVLVNDEHITKTMFSYLGEILPPDDLDMALQKRTFTEDFAEIACRIPSLMIMLGGGDISEGCEFTLHNQKAIFNEKMLPIGAAALAHCAMRYLEDNK